MWKRYSETPKRTKGGITMLSFSVDLVPLLLVIILIAVLLSFLMELLIIFLLVVERIKPMLDDLRNIADEL